MRVGIIGAGQLARMMLEDASALGIDVTVLAESPDDGAAQTCTDVVIASATDEAGLRVLASRCDVLTLDHELVDLDLLALGGAGDDLPGDEDGTPGRQVGDLVSVVFQRVICDDLQAGLAGAVVD